MVLRTSHLLSIAAFSVLTVFALPNALGQEATHLSCSGSERVLERSGSNTPKSETKRKTFTISLLPEANGINFGATPLDMFPLIEGGKANWTSDSISIDTSGELTYGVRAPIFKMRLDRISGSLEYVVSLLHPNWWSLMTFSGSCDLAKPKF